jgi:hypothetical protein
MKAQDAWCLKAQAAASTGQLSLLEGESFPSSLELDVIVGQFPLPISLICRGLTWRCPRFSQILNCEDELIVVNVHCYEVE